MPPLTDPIPELKTQAARALCDALKDWQREDAAAIIRSDKFRIADLRAGRLERFSLVMLIRFLARVHFHVDLTITRVPRPYARSTPSSE